MSFLANLILFSPLLFIGFLILLILDRKDSLRASAGLSRHNQTSEPDQDTNHNGEESHQQDDNNTHTHPNDETLNGLDLDYEIIEPGPDDAIEPTESALQQDDDGDGGDDDLDAHLNNDTHDGSGNDSDHPEQGPSGTRPRTNPKPPKTRIVGKKKAASLARRDQRRAYHEFLRAQATERARQNAELEQELEEKLFEEKRRRALAEEEIAARKEKERKEKYEKEKLQEQKRKQDVIRLKDIVVVGYDNNGRLKGQAWSVPELAKRVQRSEKWVIESLRMEGLVGVRDIDGERGKRDDAWEIRMITGDNYYVVLAKREIDAFYASLDASGSKGMKWSEMAKALEELVAK